MTQEDINALQLILRRSNLDEVFAVITSHVAQTWVPLPMQDGESVRLVRIRRANTGYTVLVTTQRPSSCAVGSSSRAPLRPQRKRTKKS